MRGNEHGEMNRPSDWQRKTSFTYSIMLPHPHRCRCNCEPVLQLMLFLFIVMHQVVSIMAAEQHIRDMSITEWRGRAYLEHCGSKLGGLSAAAGPPHVQAVWRVCWWPSAETRASWSLLWLRQSSPIYCCCSSWHTIWSQLLVLTHLNSADLR